MNVPACYCPVFCCSRTD